MGDPSVRPSFHWLRQLWPSKKLPLPPDLTQIQGELFDLRAQVEEVHRIQRKLAGKVYRGVALGETVETGKEAVSDDITDVDQFASLPASKLELYQKAALLRRH